MTDDPILDLFCQELADEVRSQNYKLPPFEPMEISPWLAMSLLQKAIRRDREDLALSAAATLLLTSPQRFWRRIAVIAFEDIGIANFHLVSLVTVALRGKIWRAKIGGEWAVASYLVRRMARSPKCRAADDLAIAASYHPDFEQKRLQLTFRPLKQLLTIMLGSRNLLERSIALWYTIGTDRCPVETMRERRGDPAAVFASLAEVGIPEKVVVIAREGFRRTNAMLCPLSILLWQKSYSSVSQIEPEVLPPEVLVGDVPGWAFDMHVREGNIYLKRLLGRDCETARWVKENVPPHLRVIFLGGILFRIESGLVAQRLNWVTANRLREIVDRKCSDMPGLDAAEIITLFRHDLPLLNQIRCGEAPDDRRA